MEYSHNISHFGTEAWNLNATSKFSVNASEPTPLGRGYVSWFSLATLGVAIISVLVWNLKSATVLRILVGRIKEAFEKVWMLSRGRSSSSSSTSTRTVPTSVNYHFTRRCNYACGFCFHTAKTSFVLPLDEAKRGLAMLAQAGMEKVNFSGGEPFLHGRGRYLGDLVRYCKEELRLPSVSVVSNGSLVTQHWFQQYGSYLDILAVSCDSFNSDTNAAIGRQQGGKDHVMSLMRVREWCTQYKVAFKLNTVVNTYNKDEDMTEEVMQLNPCRWKVFQCLVIPGENAGEDALRNAEKFVISDEEFQQYLERHKDVSCLVPESNDAMRYSYLILDEYMRFLDGGTKKPSPSLLDVGVQNAIDGANFDEKMFFKRGGKYTWTKADMRLEW